MVRKICTFKKLFLICCTVFFPFQTVKSQGNVHIVSKDTLKIVSIENANIMIVDDFKIYFDEITFLFSKNTFLDYLKLYEKKEHIGLSNSEFESEIDFISNLIKENKDVLITDFANTSNRKIWNFYLKPLVSDLMDNSKIIVFYKKQIIKLIHKLRIKRIGDEFSGTSIEYWHNDILILQLEIEATID